MKWFSTQVIVVTLICSLVSVAIPRQPIRGANGCPPVCNDGNYWYGHSVLLNVSGANTMYNTKQLPTSSQLSAVADTIDEAVTENYNNWIGKTTAFVVDNAQDFESPSVNPTALMQLLANAGYTPKNSAQIVQWALNSTYAQRVAFVETTRTYGFGYYLTNTVSATYRSIAGEMVKHGGKLPPDFWGNTCGDLAAITAMATLIGLLVSIVQPEVGLGVGIIGGFAGFLFWVGC
jgi:hypothetical protein